MHVSSHTHPGRWGGASGGGNGGGGDGGGDGGGGDGGGDGGRGDGMTRCQPKGLSCWLALCTHWPHWLRGRHWPLEHTPRVSTVALHGVPSGR